MRVVLLGPPGVGKGTQGARLAAQWGVPHIATGTILRQILATGEDSAWARAARVIEQGAMVSDDFANDLALRELERPAAARGFVLDGYPRNVAQAMTLEAFLATRGERLDAAIALQMDAETLAERLAGRRACRECGATYHVRAFPPRRAGICDRCGGPLAPRAEDDRPQKIAIRRALYGERTAPLIAFYEDRGLLRRVEAAGMVDVVYRAVCAALGGLV